MKIKCHIKLVDSPHLYLLYRGFIRLKSKGIIELTFEHKKHDELPKPIVEVLVNDKINVIYDYLDGFNWIDSDQKANLNYFNSQFSDADFYFKRSYHSLLEKVAPEGLSTFPLGLFYRVERPDIFETTIKFKIKKTLKSWLGKETIPPINFNHPPLIENHRAMLFTRLWNPDEVDNQQMKDERRKINQSRIETIETCKKVFKDKFIGGISDTPMARKLASHLILDKKLTHRRQYLEEVKKSSIVIVNAGLHNSIGGRFAEAVAASRAIISEPLYFNPGEALCLDKNYLQFASSEELITKVDHLLSNKNTTLSMMNENFKYNQKYLEPDQLVLNSLKKVTS